MLVAVFCLLGVALTSPLAECRSRDFKRTEPNQDVVPINDDPAAVSSIPTDDDEVEPECRDSCASIARERDVLRTLIVKLQGKLDRLKAQCSDHSSPAPTAASGCPSGYTYYAGTGSCYKFDRTGASWDNVASKCRADRPGSHLVFIESQAEENYIASLLSDHQIIWTGGRRQNPPGDMSFVWKSDANTTVKRWNGFMDWCQYHPTAGNGGENCIQMKNKCNGYEWGTVGWKDEDCSIAFQFICEYELEAA